MEHFNQIITSHPLLRQKNQLVGCGRKVKNSESQSHGVTQAFLAQDELEKYNKEKIYTRQQIYGLKMSLALKRLLEIDFHCIWQHMFYLFRKFNLEDKPAMKENNCHIFKSLVSMHIFSSENTSCLVLITISHLLSASVKDALKTWWKLTKLAKWSWRVVVIQWACSFLKLEAFPTAGFYT